MLIKLARLVVSSYQHLRARTSHKPDHFIGRDAYQLKISYSLAGQTCHTKIGPPGPILTQILPKLVLPDHIWQPKSVRGD